jgi:tetratricopeptide (TPR) repeat protein
MENNEQNNVSVVNENQQEAPSVPLTQDTSGQTSESPLAADLPEASFLNSAEQSELAADSTSASEVVSGAEDSTAAVSANVQVPTETSENVKNAEQEKASGEEEPAAANSLKNEEVEGEAPLEGEAASAEGKSLEEGAESAAVAEVEAEPEEEIPPPLPSYKILENKRKIITRIRAKDPDSGIVVFFETFSKHYPADLEFLNTLFTELTRTNNYDTFYTLLQQVAIWYEDDKDYNELSENVTRLYIDNLVLKGNNNVFERNERLEIIRKNSRRSELELSKTLETDKILQSLSKKAIESFEQALVLDPENLPALNGAKNCYEFVGDFVKFEKTMETIESVLMKKSGIVEKLEKEEAKTKEEEAKDMSEQAFEQFQNDFTTITNLFIEEKDEEFIAFYEKIHNPNNPYTPLILLKARVMARMRKFKESDRLIEMAEKGNSHFPELNEAKTEIRKIKHALYKKAADYYLERALLKGITFGKPDFVKAKEALEKAMHFVTDDITMLDQYHTVLKYLKKDREAFKTKGIIYSIDPSYTTSFEQELSNRMCFIASFAFAEQPWLVDDFRWYRREFLLNSDFGKRLNCLYVTISPKVVQAMAPYRIGVYASRVLLLVPLLIIKLLQKCTKK